ncbi:P-loop NTPase, partial [Haloarcula hispanica]
TSIANEVREAMGDIDREIDLSASVDRGVPEAEDPLPKVKNVIAVASGKGGVGKSTVAVNLAAGLSRLGARVGLFDADVYGPNVPRMLDADESPRATEDEEIIPVEKHGMKLMSMDFLVGKDDPVIFRGPMVDNVLTQLWDDVLWGELDYMVVDL